MPERPSETSGTERLYSVTVTFDDYPCSGFPEAESVRLLMDGTNHTPEQIRAMCAEHYAVPLAQVGEAKPTTREAYEFEVEEVW